MDAAFNFADSSRPGTNRNLWALRSLAMVQGGMADSLLTHRFSVFSPLIRACTDRVCFRAVSPVGVARQRVKVFVQKFCRFVRKR